VERRTQRRHPATRAAGASSLTRSRGDRTAAVSYVDTSYLDTPRQYRHERDNLGNALPVTCKTEVAGCPSLLIDRISGALTNPEAQSAFASHTVFGVDKRPSDGQVFRITVGSGYVEVGDSCDAILPKCYIPSWAYDLVNLLKQLDAQELAKKACTDVFGT
jgi:hypothetical protein